ncbi:MAG: glycosyltransferase family 2 protein [Gemmatimonadaceae bacterium]
MTTPETGSATAKRIVTEREGRLVPERATELEVSPSLTRRPGISVVIPVYNEVGSLDRLYRELSTVLASVASTSEIIFIDDGSRDGSLALLERIASKDPAVSVLSFRLNMGKAAALNVGFAEAREDIVITMDADLQDQPSEIPRLLAALEGWDVVSGWKRVRHDPFGKRIPSKLFNAATRWLTGIHLNDFNCGFKAYRRDVVRELDLYGELHRYIPVLATWRGFRCSEVAIDHAPRLTGESKYGSGRLLKGAYDLLTVVLITRFEMRPMHFFGSIGVVLGAVGFVTLTYLSWLRLVLQERIGDRPLLLLGIVMLLAGIQLVSVGLLGELVVRRSRDRHLGEPMRRLPRR